MKNFCLDIREHATKIINYEKKEMIPLPKEEKDWHNMQKVCHICKEVFSTDYNNKKYHKIKDHCHYIGKYRGAAHDICNLNLVNNLSEGVHNNKCTDCKFYLDYMTTKDEQLIFRYFR